MNVFKKVVIGLGLSITSLNLFASEPVFTEAQKNNANRLMEKALSSDLGFEIVESLTTEVGPRLAGSAAEERAREWGVKLGEKLGFDKVTMEQFKMPFWDRGELHIFMN